MRTIDWRDGRVVIVDQTRLPAALRTLELTSVDELVDAIARLAVRGAPALGAAGALGVVLAVDQAEREGWDDERLVAQLAQLRAARPTAVNLAWGIDRAASRLTQGREAVLKEALAVLEEDVTANRSIGARGADLLDELLTESSAATQGIRVHTHCNTGSLATVEWGTALGVDGGGWAGCTSMRPVRCFRGAGSRHGSSIGSGSTIGWWSMVPDRR